MRKLEVIRAEEHMFFRYTPPKNQSHAKGRNIIPITLGEMELLCCDYPLVFTDNVISKVALIAGIRSGESVAVNSAGKWLGEYVPAEVRRYPFTIVRNSEGIASMAMDTASGCFDDPNGVPMFDDYGTPSNFMNDIFERQKRLEDEYKRTRAFVDALEEKGLVDDSLVRIKVSGEEHDIRGFKSVMWESVRALEDSDLANLTRNGWIKPLIYHARSLENFEKISKLLNK